MGCGGAGKTTFAAELGRRTGLPVIHLDRHYWRPGWVETPAAQWRAAQTALAAGEAWIIDGNYGSTLDVRFARADTVIILALPRWRCIARVLGRWLASRGRAVQADGCPEHVAPTFLCWIWRYRTQSRPRIDAALEPYRDRLHVVELTTPREVKRFLDYHATDQASREPDRAQ